MAASGAGRRLHAGDVLYRKVNPGEYEGEAIDPTAFIDKYPRQIDAKSRATPLSRIARLLSREETLGR